MGPGGRRGAAGVRQMRRMSMSPGRVSDNSAVVEAIRKRSAWLANWIERNCRPARPKGVALLSALTEPRWIAPRSLAAIAARASAPAASDRYESVTALADDVLRFRDGDPVSAYRESVLERAARLYRRYQLPILLVLAYVIMRTVLLIWRGI